MAIVSKDGFKMKYRAAEVRIVSASSCPTFRLAPSTPKYLSPPPNSSQLQPTRRLGRAGHSIYRPCLFPTQVTGGCMEGGLAGASGVTTPGGAGGGGGGADKEKPSRGSAKRGRDGSKPGKAGN